MYSPVGSTQAVRSLRILVIASTYPRHEDDYAVPWLRTSVQHLVERGHRVSVLAPSYKGLGSHQIDGVMVHRFRYGPACWEQLTHEEGAPSRIRNHPLYQLMGLPYVCLGLRAGFRLARREPFDIVHVHWPFPHGPIGLAAARACGAKVVMTCHGAEFAMARRKRWTRPLLRHSLRRADLLLANSTDTAKHIESLSGCKAAVLPFGSTVAAAPILPPENETPALVASEHRISRVLFTGRLIQRKGVEYLLRAVPLILARRQAEFIITGDGDQRASLESLSHALHLDDSVRFLGFVTNKQLEAQYARCDVWVNPSIIDDNGDTEGLGVGAIEAYAHRKPVVASAVGGIPDAVRHGITGLLVREKDSRQLADAIVTILDDPERATQMADAGFRFAQETFDWSNLTRRLEDMYYETLAEKQPAERPVRSRFSLLRKPFLYPSSRGNLACETSETLEAIDP
ncbi:MAG: glycosyltransferase family 4 protein [Planctomycetes bacterium]|nr:glycosyltransferase family 4 protein [Planctomycetota bacterium]